MEKKVLIPSDISQPGKDYLAEKGYTIKMGRGTDEQTILEDVADCDALLARNEHITRAIMEAAPRLKVISKHGVGLDKIDLDAARELNIWVTNGPLSNTVAVAEHTMMLILACAKKLVFFDRAARRGDYDIRNRVKGMDLEGKTLGLLGLGKIGHMVAKKAINGFGMEVIGYDPFLPADRWDPEVGRRETMEEIFAGSDIVSIHVVLTPETTHVFNREVFKKMKNSAMIINTSRGPVIDNDDLVWALQNGEILYAGLDTVEREPLPENDPLKTLDNVIVNPHCGSYGVGSKKTQIQMVCDLVPTAVTTGKVTARCVADRDVLNKETGFTFV